MRRLTVDEIFLSIASSEATQSHAVASRGAERNLQILKDKELSYGALCKASLLWLLHTADAVRIRGLEAALLGRAAGLHVPQLQLLLLRQPAGRQRS